MNHEATLAARKRLRLQELLRTARTVRAAPLSFAQQRMWLAQQLDPTGAAYTIAETMRLRGPLDAPALRRALGAVVARHEALRTVFEAAGGEPVQVVRPPAPLSLSVADLSSVDDAVGEARRRARAEAARPFDLARGPLFRAVLLRLGARDHVLLLSLHHLVADGWSVGVLVREVAEAYRAFSAGRAPRLEPLPVQYADYAAWQRRELTDQAQRAQLDWWRARLAGAPPRLELATDRPRPPVQGAAGGRRALRLDPALAGALRALSRRERTTLYVTLLAGWQALLARCSGQDDVSVGTPVAGRTRVELEPLIGLFINTVVLRGELGGDPSFRQAARRARETVLGAFAHQDVPFDRVVDELAPERGTAHTPLFQSVFTFVETPPAEEPHGLSVEPLGGARERVKFDLVLEAADEAEQDGGGVLLSLAWRAELWDEATIAAMMERYAVLLASAAAEPDAPLSGLGFLLPGERGRLLVLAEGGPAPNPPALIHELVRAQAARTPGAEALRFGGRSVGYAELVREAERMARWLRRRGVGPEARVALWMEPAVETAVTVLAVLMAGGAYVPLDPAAPRERTRWMLGDAAPLLVLTQRAIAAGVEDLGVPVLAVDGGEVRAEVAAQAEGAPESGVLPENLAYVIYTSGSTGRPKGVLVEHRCVCNTFRQMARVYGAGPGERNLAFAPLHFDASVADLFVALSSGATLVMAPRETMIPGPELLRLLEGERVTHVRITPSALAPLPPAELPELATLVCTGEPCTAELMARWAPGRRFLNGYGATEAGIRMTSTRYADVTRDPPVGRPIPNTRLLVLDRWLEPCPAGVAGEIYIGGPGTARGYLARPGLSAERFVPDPFAARPGARMYRTGDRGRRRADGEIEFLGRVDFQVKVRGFRVEPGEVEAALRERAGARQAVVLLREDAPGDRRLVAYVVPGQAGATSPAALRAALVDRLPDYMLPQAFVVLERLPLTSSGKLDRRALPAPATDAGGDGHTAPRTPAEEVLAAVWATLLRRDAVGVDDDFFELGGHSLLAARVIGRVREVFGVEVPLRALFEAPTVGGLAARIAGLRAAGTNDPGPPPVPAPRGAPLPLSFSQQRLWFLHQLAPESAAYNLPYPLRLRGPLDRGALARAFAALVARHEVLRTVYRSVAGRPVQEVRAIASVPLPLVDLRGLDAETREAELSRRVRREALRPFDLERGPVIRATLLALAPDEHALLVTLHHVASDGWSTEVMIREVSAFYAAFAAGRDPVLPPLPVQYADHAVWQRGRLRGPVLEAQVDWWRSRLAGLPPLLELPTDRARPAAPDGRAAAAGLALAPATAAAVRALARREGATPFMVLLAAWQTVLGRWAATDDVCVGTPVAGRTRVEVEELVGFFANTLALRADLSGDPSFRALLARVREATLSAWSHQEVPFERLVEALGAERSLGHTPLVQVIFNLLADSDDELTLGPVRVDPLPLPAGPAKFDLVLTAAQAGEGLNLTLVYRTELWDAASGAALLRHLAAVLDAAAADPELPLSRISLGGGAQDAAPGATGYDDAPPHDDAAPPLVHERFAAQAARTPRAAAVVFRGRETTYAELDRASARLAGHLRRRGVRTDDRVGVLLERGPELVAAVLGILRAGAAYLPLDPADPPARAAAVLADAGARALVTRDALAAPLAAFAGAVVRVDADADEIAAGDARAPEGGAGERSLAYVVYTSGSTGAPKGVMVEHGGLARYLEFFEREVRGGDGFALPWVSRLSFDAHVRQLFPPLLRGEAVWVLADDAAADPAALLAEIGVRPRASFGGVPSLWSALLELVETGRAAAPAGLAAVLLGGEALPPELLRRTFAAFPRVTVWNHYGPTEATVNTTVARLGPGDAVTLGEPVPHARVYLLDALGRPVPAGVPGELYVGGAAVSRGYLGRPGATAAAFLPDPFAGRPGARMYRSGDRVRRRADGRLDFVGRVDEQVKVRGFRIEPGEVEAALRAVPGVAAAAVAAREDGPGGARLVGWVVPAPGAALSAKGVREALRARLPGQLVPSAVVFLDALPLNANGKVDRRALPAPAAPSAEADEDFAAPRTPAEEVLAAIWADVLGVERVRVDESFWTLGGHSLLATRVVARAREAFGVELPLRALFEASSVAGMAERVEELRRAGAADAAPPLGPADRSRPLPLSFAQQRLWFLDQLEPGSSAYNMPYALRVRGPFRAAALRVALTALARRHEALRTRFPTVDGAPVQRVDPPAPVPVTRVDLAALGGDRREAEARRRVEAEALRPFDLARGPLLRCTVLRLGEADHVVLFTLHHAVADAWSMDVLVREVSALHAAALEGRDAGLPPLPVQYADFAAWQRGWLAGEVLEGELAYWRGRLGGAPPLLDVPTDRPRLAAQDPRAGARPLVLAPELSARLRALARREGATLHMVLLAAWAAFLGRAAGQDDVVVGTPVTGRSHAALEGLIGFFVNLLPIRAAVGGEASFTGLLRAVREAALGAYAHASLPFERLVEELAIKRSLTHAPLVQAIFSLNPAGGHGDVSLGGAALEDFGGGGAVAKFDLHLAVEDGDAIAGTLQYRRALWAPGTIDRMLGRFAALLAAVAEDPGRRLGQVSLMAADERRRVLQEWSGAVAPPAPAGTVHALFCAQARATPGAVAVLCGGQSLTYAELDARSTRLARRLRAAGVRPDAPVGLLLERSLEVPEALLAILKAGGAYLPLDPAYPDERLALLLADAGVEVLLTRAELVDRVPAWGGARVRIGGEADGETADAEGEYGASALAPGVEDDAGRLAYVMYTSGSTGTPKGVAVPHRAVVRLVRGNDYARLGPGETLLQYAPLAFDASTFEIWGALLNGGRLAMAPAGPAHSRGAGGGDRRERGDHGVAHRRAPARAGRGAPLGAARRCGNWWRAATCCAPAHLRRAGRGVSRPAHRQRLRPDREHHLHLLPRRHRGRPGAPGAVPLGRAGRAAPPRTCSTRGWRPPRPGRVPGELYAGGAGVARGYLRRPGATAERFVPDPFVGRAGRAALPHRRPRPLAAGRRGRVPRPARRAGQDPRLPHRAGRDGGGAAGPPRRARRRPWTCAARAPAAAWWPGPPRAAETAPTPDELRAHLAARLPEYLVPGAVVVLDALPLNASGKVDRSALPDPAAGVGEGGVPRTLVEEGVAAIWREVMALPSLGVDDDFFRLGGHSLLATQIVARVRRAFGVELPLRALFDAPTVAGLAAATEEALLAAYGDGAADPDA